MKKATIILIAMIAVMLAGCKKTTDELTSSSSGKELKKTEQSVPFNGSITGVITTVPSQCTGWIGRHFEGIGNVTHMGKTEVTMDYCMKTEFPSPDPGIDAIVKGPGVFKGANGDELHGYLVGTVVFKFVQGNPNPVSGHVEADAVLYDGTGNFEGAHGFIHGKGEMDFTAGTNIPFSWTFTGTIHYGSEFFEETTNGLAYYTGSCGTGKNAYTYSGPLTGTLPGPASLTMSFCATTAFAPPPYPPTLAIGGTNEGTGEITDGNADHLTSAYTTLYRFTYLPNLLSPTSILNDAMGIGKMTGGTGVYENATGIYVFTGEQTLILGPNGPQFPAASTFHVIGWLNHEDD